MWMAMAVKGLQQWLQVKMIDHERQAHNKARLMDDAKIVRLM